MDRHMIHYSHQLPSDRQLDLTRKLKISLVFLRLQLFLTDFCNKVFVSDLIIRTVSRTSFSNVPSICWPIAKAFGLFAFT